MAGAATGLKQLAIKAYFWRLRRQGDPLLLLLSADLWRDPYPIYERIRSHGPIARSALKLHAVTSHALASEVMRDWSSDPRNSNVQGPIADDVSLLNLDPPDHTRVRSLVAAEFSARRIATLTAMTEEVAESVVAGAVAKGEFDVMKELAYPLPVAIICELLGIDRESGELIKELGYRLAPTLDFNPPVELVAENAEFGRQMDEFFLDLLATRRADPRDDVISNLLKRQAAGADITDDELGSLCALILLAGFVTTVNLIGSGLAALLEHPEQLALLRDDPSLIPNAVDEMLRWESPVQFTGRIPTEDQTLYGVRVLKGEQTVVMLGAANRDPAVFVDPDRFDVTRANANKHLAFATGIHHCLGAALARMEGEKLFAALLAQTSSIELAGAPVRRPIQNLRGYDSFPVRVRPR